MPQVPVSVVIPVYNGARWIAEAISSVAAQNYPLSLIDVVVVDDGSSDDSAAVAEALLERTSIHSQVMRVANGGPSRARNIGWRAAKGEWIQFLDSDDVVTPEKIAAQAHAAADVAVIYSDWRQVRQVNNEWVPIGGTWSPSLDADSVASLLDARQFIHSGSALFRKAWLERVDGWDERHWLIEDVDLLLRIAMAGGEFQRAESHDALFEYRHYDAVSLSRRNRTAFHDGCIRNAVLVENHWRAAGEISESRARILAKIYHQSARYFAAADRRRFEELVERIVKLVPGFVPESPALLRSVSRMVGFRRAELLSVQYQRVRGRSQSV